MCSLFSAILTENWEQRHYFYKRCILHDLKIHDRWEIHRKAGLICCCFHLNSLSPEEGSYFPSYFPDSSVCWLLSWLLCKHDLPPAVTNIVTLFTHLYLHCLFVHTAKVQAEAFVTQWSNGMQSCTVNITWNAYKNNPKISFLILFLLFLFLKSSFFSDYPKINT